MDKLSKIALIPYFIYVWFKSFLLKFKAKKSSLKHADYHAWLSQQENLLGKKKIFEQKIVALIDQEDPATIKSLHEADITYIIVKNELIYKNTIDHLKVYDAFIVLKGGELISANFKKGLPLLGNRTIIYSDFGTISKGKLTPNNPLKNWDLYYFYSKNYISRSFICSTQLLFDGLKLDDDLLTQIVIKKNFEIDYHPFTLFHLLKPDINLQFRQKYLQTKLPSANVKINENYPLFDINFNVKKTPLVSIIIPTKDNVEFLSNCIKSISENSIYQNFEFIILDNNSVTTEFKHFYKDMKTKKKFTFIKSNFSFNYSKLNNLGAKYAKGEYYIFLNNDTQVISKDWINSFLGYLQLENTGAVGAQLLYSNNKIQHAGVQLGIEGAAGHVYSKVNLSEAPEFSQTTSSYKALTGACLAVSRKNYNLVGGFDEKNLAIEFNDLDFCLKLGQKNQKNIYLPFVKLYHLESITRGTTHNSWSSLLRYKKERTFFLKKWDQEIQKA